MDAARLGRAAERHAFELDCDRDRPGTSDDVPTDRLVVNFLRHQCTDYDEDRTQERHRQACEAIARRFSWLAEECERQIERRARSEREGEEMVAEYERQQHESQAKRRETAEKSRQVIMSMTVGQKVWFEDRCYTYVATVTKIGRSKVTVAYQVKTGNDRDRSKTVHAALVTPIGAEG
ncbi:MAG: hypothetical protein ABIQ18_46225 [Umezawaea sp.]